MMAGNKYWDVLQGYNICHNLRGQKSLGPLKMSLEMAHKVIVPQKKIMSRSFLNSGTLIVICPFCHISEGRPSLATADFKLEHISGKERTGGGGGLAVKFK